MGGSNKKHLPRTQFNDKANKQDVSKLVVCKNRTEIIFKSTMTRKVISPGISSKEGVPNLL